LTNHLYVLQNIVDEHDHDLNNDIIQLWQTEKSMNHKWGYHYGKYSSRNQSKQKNTFASYLHNVGNISHGLRIIESYHLIFKQLPDLPVFL
jgi:hypothetical protein